jgi:RNA polymerase-binding transcription factor DksA
MEKDKYDLAWDEYERNQEERRQLEAASGWREERDARLARAGIGNVAPRGDGQCIHCGQPFFSYTSTGGSYGMCQGCID